MMVSTKGRYALRVMIDLAQCGGDRLVPLMDISQRQGISEKYLEGIMSSLSKEGLVYAARGAHGGYRLVKTPDEYSIFSILKTTEKTLAPVACLDCGNECSRAAECKTLPMWKRLDDVVREYLESVSLGDLVENRIR
ncbi:MAG: Rrf2 family transcriptional regulator [Clostridiales bacterium]|nr:Rrf2 family transcriptional regulator [Clostridiales bacterium]